MLYLVSVVFRQLTGVQLVAAGINPGMVRLWVGLENIDGILEDIEKVLACV